MLEYNDDDEKSYQRLLQKAFNEYCQQNGLNYSLDLYVLNQKTSTQVVDDYGSTINALTNRRSTEYDIFYYYSAYSQKYGDHFLNLEEYLSDEYIEVYDKSILEETCTSKDNKLVGLPIYLFVSTLFSNQDYLSKYNMTIPRTWDELISKSKTIFEEEKNIGNTVIRYNGLINDYMGSMSVYEFINSFRESNESPHPYITSETTKKALKKLKEMKDEFGEDQFKAPIEVTFDSLFNTGKMLFIRSFYMEHLPIYSATALPGQNENVSGTIIIPNNFAVNKYIDEDRKQGAVEFMKFISLKETQKKYIISNKMFSAITELYDDEEVCSQIDCNVMKEAYPFSFMSNDEDFFADDNYHTNYKLNIFDYIYNNKDVTEVLKKIEDITKIYQLSLKTDDYTIGLILFIVYLVFLIIIILSLRFLFIKKLEKRFRFLSKPLWIITTLGTLILLSSVLSLYGEVTSAKCHLKTVLINLGFVLSVSPSLIMLIANFPKRNKFSSLIENSKYSIITITMVITIGLNEILVMSSYDTPKITMTDGRNFKRCVMNHSLGIVFYYIIRFYEFFIIFISLFLIFLEWNLEKTRLDVKYLATALFMDTLSLIILIIMDNIKFKNFSMYNILLALNIFIFSVSNHLFIYLVRVLPMFRPNNDYDDFRKLLGLVGSKNQNDSKKHTMPFSSNKSLSNNSSYKNSNFAASFNTTTSNKSSIHGIIKKIMGYHNQTDISMNDQNQENRFRNYRNQENMQFLNYQNQSSGSTNYQNQSNRSLNYLNQSNNSTNNYQSQSNNSTNNYQSQSNNSMNHRYQEKWTMNYQIPENMSKNHHIQSTRSMSSMNYHNQDNWSMNHQRKSSMSKNYLNQSNRSVSHKKQASMSNIYQNQSNRLKYYQKQTSMPRNYQNQSNKSLNYQNQANIFMDY